MSPANGVFQAGDGIVAGAPVGVGHLIGRVGDHDVRSPFAGELMGILALEGERVTASQPIAWLRTN